MLKHKKSLNAESVTFAFDNCKEFDGNSVRWVMSTKPTKDTQISLKSLLDIIESKNSWGKQQLKDEILAYLKDD